MVPNPWNRLYMRKIRFRESNNLPKDTLQFPDFSGSQVHASNHFSKHVLAHLSIPMQDKGVCSVQLYG